jgi:hypothetical protein
MDHLPHFTEASPSNSLLIISQPIGGCLQGWIGNPTGLDSTACCKVLYLDHHFCHSCHLFENKFSKFKLKQQHSCISYYNLNCTAKRTSWHFPTTKKNGLLYQPLAAVVKRHIAFEDMEGESSAIATPTRADHDQQQSATSPCPSLELAGQLSGMSLVEETETSLLPEVG